MLALLLLGGSTLGSGCIRVKPLVIDNPHAQLENQILGQLRRLRSPLVLASSVRGRAMADATEAAPPNPAIATAETQLSPLAREARDAALSRAFNADDLEQLKASQTIGEGHRGELVILELPKRRAAAERLRRLVAQENRDRSVLMRRALQLTVGASERDLPRVRRLFVLLVRQTARSGHRLQCRDGSWQTVAEGRGMAVCGAGQ